MSSKPKVICLGLGRTGTLSLSEALNQLGFGPCYHMTVVFENHNVDEVNTWINLGKAQLDDLRAVLKDHNSVTDYPAAIYYEQLYQAYPDAKFILTTRDPAKWEASMKATILPAISNLKYIPEPDAWWISIRNWLDNELLGCYHQGKLYTDAQGEITVHNQRVMQTIPTDKLLVYEVSQGWDPLVNFLGVEKPDTPFPHLNDRVDYHKRVAKNMDK